MVPAINNPHQNYNHPKTMTQNPAMDIPKIKTLGQLKASEYQPRSIKQELRENLLTHLKKGTTVFEGIYGYENTVIPAVERALLAGHNLNFLGLRGQAKTRMARQMTTLLDEYIPAVAGSELADDPLAPISRQAKEIIAEKGDATPLRWIHRSERYYEKLATPDVTVADLIGDVDPIKAANLKLPYSDERTLHFGMIPRAHRSIFVINELPDLQARLQVALFNILQEGDIQIRGFQLRLPLDVQFVFTANPEDYTNRGSIVTPLKDRIGSQILTHYPEDLATARKITAQEARLNADQQKAVKLPDVAYDLLEQISFEARDNEYVDAESGVSARLTISALENLVSAAERRNLINGSKQTTVRLSDFLAIVPAITGKVELVYEGDQAGAQTVAEHLIATAVKRLTERYFPPLGKLKASDEESPYKALIDHFGGGHSLELLLDASDKEYRQTLESVAPLEKLRQQYLKEVPREDQPFWLEMLLWSLAEHNKLERQELRQSISFSDLFSSYLSGK